MPEEAIRFQRYNPHKDVRIYHNGSLPHRRQDGCTYFVTFRLADSLPQSALNKLREKRDNWLHAHRIDPDQDDWRDQFSKLPEEQRRDFERQIANNMNVELDRGYGSCALRDPELSEIVGASLEFHHAERLWTGDYIIMPNHVHLLMTPIAGNQMQDILKSIKNFTGARINQALNQDGTLWQRDSYDHIVRDIDQLRAFQRYIANNPTTAHLRPGSYRLKTAEYTFDP